jgi:hypothetical protein
MDGLAADFQTVAKKNRDAELIGKKISISKSESSLPNVDPIKRERKYLYLIFKPRFLV